VRADALEEAMTQPYTPPDNRALDRDFAILFVTWPYLLVLVASRAIAGSLNDWRVKRG
jgi:hypothetical protein